MAKKKRSWRATVRALHRDLGYLVVGLTMVYAISGLAVNHIADWDPSFSHYEELHALGALSGESDAALVAEVVDTLEIEEAPRSVYRASPERLDVTFERRTLHINPGTGEVLEEGQRPRFFLRMANWLHLNRGKAAWTMIADLFAVGLILLAVTGLMMLPARKVFRGRGAALLGAGVLLPLVYVLISGGP